MLAGALNASRVPVPEPSIFSGDALRYSNWKLSFNTLIDQKNIPENENIFYLRRCVSGQAKSTLDGYFLLGTETAYASAWKILNERYGNPFSVAKAYRDKLQAWPEAAMVHIKALEILNDCSEDSVKVTRLATASWNHKVIEIEEQTRGSPTFSQFVSFLTREAKIACNPVISLQSLKQVESDNSERLRITRQRNTGAKTLATTSQEKRDFTFVLQETQTYTPEMQKFSGNGCD